MKNTGAKELIFMGKAITAVITLSAKPRKNINSPNKATSLLQNGAIFLSQYGSV